MREALSNSLVKAAKNNPKIILLTGDHGYTLFDEFRKIFPAQYLNAGIAEQNMVGMAAGLARSGYFPIVYGLSAFVPIRVLEQIKLDVCHDNLPVIFLGDGAGFVYSSLGTSHQSMEDIAATRSIPQLAIFSPADRFEMAASMDLALSIGSPAYIRIGKSDVGDVHAETVQMRLGELLAINKTKSRIAFIATGSMVKVAHKLSEEFEGASIYSAPSIKPFNQQKFLNLISGAQLIVSLEEHSIYGGLGGMLAEILSEYRPTSLLRIGVKDCFSRRCGTYQYLLKEHGLDLDAIKKRVRAFIAVLD